MKVPGDMSLKAAAERMKKDGVGSLLVEDRKQIVGIVTETDIVQKLVAAGLPAEETSVESVMSFPLITVEGDMPVKDAARMMVENGIRHLAVEDNGVVSGMVSMRDLLRLMLTSQNRSGN